MRASTWGGCVLVCFWSPKGGSGTSVVTAASGLLLARDTSARIADLAGDQPSILGLAKDPELGLHDWLRAGLEAPADALERVAVEVGRGVSLLPTGTPGLGGVAPE